jgi:hypothetical protein
VREYICQGYAATDGFDDETARDLVEMITRHVHEEATDMAVRLLMDNRVFCGTLKEQTGRDSSVRGVRVNATLTDYGDIIGRLNEGIANIEKIPGTSKTTKIVKEMVLGVLKKIRGDDDQ